MGEDGGDLEAADQAEAGDFGGGEAGDVAALEGDGAAGGLEELGEEVEAGGFAGAVGADERVDATLAHGERDGVDGDEAAEFFRQSRRCQDGV